MRSSADTFRWMVLRPLVLAPFAVLLVASAGFAASSGGSDKPAKDSPIEVSVTSTSVGTTTSTSTTSSTSEPQSCATGTGELCSPSGVCVSAGAYETADGSCLADVERPDGDVDCIDIPPSAKPVKVIGVDVYGLDPDGAGIGCAPEPPPTTTTTAAPPPSTTRPAPTTTQPPPPPRPTTTTTQPPPPPPSSPVSGSATISCPKPNTTTINVTGSGTVTVSVGGSFKSGSGAVSIAVSSQGGAYRVSYGSSGGSASMTWSSNVAGCVQS